MMMEESVILEQTEVIGEETTQKKAGKPLGDGETVVESPIFENYTHEQCKVLCQAIKDYLSTTEDFRLDWMNISERCHLLNLEIEADECRRLWQYLAYGKVVPSNTDPQKTEDSDEEDIVFNPTQSITRFKRKYEGNHDGKEVETSDDTDGNKTSEDSYKPPRIESLNPKIYVPKALEKMKKIVPSAYSNIIHYSQARYDAPHIFDEGKQIPLTVYDSIAAIDAYPLSRIVQKPNQNQKKCFLKR